MRSTLRMPDTAFAQGFNTAAGDTTSGSSAEAFGKVDFMEDMDMTRRPDAVAPATPELARALDIAGVGGRELSENAVRTLSRAVLQDEARDGGQDG
mmetsp:Transcript_94911/g.306388  ORF Transcript_94911/g.306388 Transcript_94911/m.306388 type:complete len:96 (+) Transcript_94911:620-907(+)